MKKLRVKTANGNSGQFGAGFEMNEILGWNAMRSIRGGDGGDSLIIIPDPPKEDEP